MHKMLLSMAFGASCFLAAAAPAQAQDGCKATALSCTQLQQNCEATCQKSSNNPSSCIARACTTPLAGCKSSGVWRSRSTSSACWKTNKLS